MQVVRAAARLLCRNSKTHTNKKQNIAYNCAIGLLQRLKSNVVFLYTIKQQKIGFPNNTYFLEMSYLLFMCYFMFLIFVLFCGVI